jgi:PIN domain nuclease of toxin-antitoxin system
MDGEPLSLQARHAIRQARLSNLGIYVSPFSAWEVGTLVTKGGLRSALAPEVWFETLIGLPGLRLAPLTPRILLNSTCLPGTPHKDPADRILAATAREYGFSILTGDKLLLDYAQLGHIQAIACR